MTSSIQMYTSRMSFISAKKKEKGPRWGPQTYFLRIITVIDLSDKFVYNPCDIICTILRHTNYILYGNNLEIGKINRIWGPHRGPFSFFLRNLARRTTPSFGITPTATTTSHPPPPTPPPSHWHHLLVTITTFLSRFFL